jgi:hypothetical protein
MDAAKRKALEAAGWRFGDAADFLGMSDEERQLLDAGVGAALAVRRQREAMNLSEKELASLRLQAILTESGEGSADRLPVFALLALGLVESLANGVLSASGAVRSFFTADNCLYVRKLLRDKAADEVMSRGVQLPDLFDALPAEEAQREFQRELAAMRTLCLKLLLHKRSVA